jgi:hypothetical protein
VKFRDSPWQWWWCDLGILSGSGGAAIFSFRQSDLGILSFFFIFSMGEIFFLKKNGKV